ncbi:MAG TPA: MaoC/PaaZ C-terminal domain-containing protein [Myxococcaceae bacterium]|jgi:acyl dehydratase|nr:MaoC/PaaZ C-terminal domain-containing protein [Myxococcaceae bacterium]
MTAAASSGPARLPGTGLSYLRALLARRPVLVPDGAVVPRIEAARLGVRVRPQALDGYRRLCGFAPDEWLPLPYPHVLATGLHLGMLTSAAFPIRPLGLVHVTNRIVVRRRLRQDEALDLGCRLEGHRETDAGQEFELHTDAGAGGAAVWSEATRFIARRPGRRGRPSGPPPEGGPPDGASRLEWSVAADTGRRYARVSGDYNPIHLFGVTARWFGFPRAIVHGMWSVARVVAEVGPMVAGPPVSLEVRFRRPVFLPSRVVLRHWPAAGGRAFLLTEPGGRECLSGTLAPLARG